ncbi:DUF11 domain-containing protein [Sphingomonas sp. IC-56]|uniref:DUF11 domain-containing protein n=1 Tax=Sphingomonas sp. IC-56 TaxID=2898529 RepID=UPI001E433760|nr:DUF11 domain-containing protein [Sphingomonas sp. IC-56]MCD2324385.1 DUF11 domain-containing protein [Sphingomonas sp. IC-56]
MYKPNLRTTLLGGVVFAASITANAAQAQQTAAGTSVNNQATVTYEVGGASASVSSNVASFVVDKKVNLTVAEVGGAPTQTSINASDQVTTFTVTNLTNAVQDFRLQADQQLVSIPLLGTDNFDMNNLRAFVDSNGNGTYEAGVDTATFIDELAPEGVVTVFIVGDTPNQPGADTAIVSLNAIVATGGNRGTLGADVTASSTLVADSPTTVETVFADDTGLLDSLRNGQQRAFDSFRISTAVMSLVKSATTISDPVNLLVNPHPIPGAVIEYCMRVNNAGPGAASNIALADAVPANSTFVPGSIAVGTSGLLGACILLGTSEDDNNTGADETDLYGGSFDGTTVRAMLPTVAAGTSMSVAFRVTVN